MATTIELPAGFSGLPIIVTCLDDSDVAQDISTYDGDISVILKSERGMTLTYSALSFVTNGSDGQVSFTPVEGDFDLVNTTGLGRVILQKTGVVATTFKFTCTVL